MRIMNFAKAALVLPAIAATPALAQESAAVADKGDTAWMLVSALLVLMMSLPGLALFYGGLVRKDNVLATLMQTLAVACVVSLVWPIVGYTLVFTEGGPWLGGLDKFFLDGVLASSLNGTIPETVFIMFQLTFAIITTALLLGSVADRIKFSAVLLFAALWVVVVYSPIAHWVWGPGGAIGGIGMEDYNGLFGLGKALDFAGGTVVHISSGIAGLVAALVLGKSIKTTQSSSNNLVLSVIGVSFLWVGWFGFNAGSAVAANASAGMAMLVTNSSAAAATLTWILIEWAHKGKPSVVGALSGVVAGLVAITPASGFVSFGGSIAIGLTSGVFCYLSVAILKEKLGYDDSLDVFGIHGIGGIVGALLTGVFASAEIGGTPGLLEGNGSQVLAQLVGVLATVVYSGLVTFVILKIVNDITGLREEEAVTGLRVEEAVEKTGLDMALHGEKVHVYN